jgi:opacity protein-like surface antigen
MDEGGGYQISYIWRISSARQPCSMSSLCSNCRWLQAGLPLVLLAALLATSPARSETSSPGPAAESQEPAPAAAKEAPRPGGVRPADQPGFYARLGAGVDWPDGSRYSDSNCASTQPPALFGCFNGNDGRRLGAYGDFDATPVLDAAMGYRVNAWVRAEALLSWRPDMDFSGNSNFLGAGANEPVSGSVSSVAGFGVAYVDLPRIGKVRPFLGAGLGVARNRMGAMTYAFPTLSATATTTTPGGSSSELAYLLTAGISVPLGDRLDLDLAYRYTDLGKVQTDAGQATVVRSSGTRSLAIGGTNADLQSHGVMLSLRYAF